MTNGGEMTSGEPAMGPEVEAIPVVPVLLTEEDFQRLALSEGYLPNLGTRTFNTLTRNATSITVPNFDQYDSDAVAVQAGKNPLRMATRTTSSLPYGESRIDTKSIVAALEQWLEGGYPIKPPGRHLGRTTLAFLARTMNGFFPDREQPFPLPSDYVMPDARPDAVAEAPPLALFEEVAVRGVTRWLVTHHTIRAFIENQGTPRKDTRHVVPFVESVAARLIRRSGGRLDSQVPPGTFVAEGVVHIGRQRMGVSDTPRPVYGIEPGAFLQEYDRAVAIIAERSVPGFGDRAQAFVGEYVSTIRGLLQLPSQ